MTDQKYYPKYPPPNPGYNQGGPLPTYYPPSTSGQQQSTVIVKAQPTAQSPLVIVSKKPSDYFCLALFTLLCCFWPLGLVALIKSIETRKQIQSGNLSQAQASSLEAKKFSIFGIVIGIACDVLVVIPVIILSAASAST